MNSRNATLTVTPNKIIADPAKRKWLYAVAVALGALAVIYKLIPREVLPYWLDLIANILGVAGPGVALLNVPTASARVDKRAQGE